MFKIFCFLIFPVLSTGKLAVLHEDTWSEILTDEWMFVLFAPRCPAYKQLEPVWKLFAEWSDDLKVGSVDVTVNPGLGRRFLIGTVPVIFHVKDGIFRQYNGSRSMNGLIIFIKEKKWQKIDPVPSFKSPQSLLMSIYVSFYGLPNLWMVKYIPYWGLKILFVSLHCVLIGVLAGWTLVRASRFFQSRTNFQPPKGPSTPDGERERGEYDVIRNDFDEGPEIRRRGEPANENEID